MDYEEARKHWSGKTDSKSLWAKARREGASHEQAVIFAVTGKKQVKCFSCGEYMYYGYRWYHADQDDLICHECARATRQNETWLRGQYVINTQQAETVEGYD